jgi:GAF domain-containing protein
VETLALLGTQAHRQSGRDATPIIIEAVEATRRLLAADRASMLELLEGAQQLELRVFSPPIDEKVVVPAGSRSFPGYVTLAGKVVIVDDITRDGRFDRNRDDLTWTPTVSAIGAPIFGAGQTLGVLIAESTRPDAYDERDAHFVQGMANVIGTALASSSA